MSTRRGGIPGPDRRTGLVRPAMSEAEFERHEALGAEGEDLPPLALADPEPASVLYRVATSQASATRSRPRAKPSKPRRVQRMFAIEEELDKKLWLYAIHVGKDRSEVVNDLLRPLVASMVLYDSRDRRSAAARPIEPEPNGETGSAE